MFTSTQNFFAKSFEELKQGNPKLTMNSYAKRIGIGVSSLKMILSGKRKPTLHQVLTLARVRRFSVPQISYLETLSLKEAARTPWEKSYYSRLLKIKREELNLQTIQTSSEDLLTDSLALPLLVDLLDSKSITIDEKMLAKRFNTKVEHIKQLIETFYEQQLLQTREDGQFHISFDKISHKHLQKKYIKASLAEANRRIDTDYDKSGAFFVTYSLSVTEDSLIRLQLELKELMEKFMAEDLGSSLQRRELAQASFQIFPITHVT